mmetsp:Transcript_14955/g.30208  ORF Transcript_14955/g.30208 Transcript_14955/m.30208 type:complete len:80 (+) Transcript_14955:851-1090(+)
MEDKRKKQKCHYADTDQVKAEKRDGSLFVRWAHANCVCMNMREHATRRKLPDGSKGKEEKDERAGGRRVVKNWRQLCRV